jgi:hypothetical protein
MITRTKQEQQNKQKRTKTDWDKLIEQFERDYNYQTNHLELRDRRADASGLSVILNNIAAIREVPGSVIQ